MPAHYIFGYDGTILPESRAHTGITGKAIPVLVSGVERGWAHPSQSMRMTTLGATYSRQGDGLCNGVLFPVPEAELPMFDERNPGYTRTSVYSRGVNLIGRNTGYPRGTIWVYSIDNPTPPTTESPIAQSYLDVMLLQCIQEFGEKFARAFIKFTAGWYYPWLNDRANPRYERHLDYSSSDVNTAVRTIDSILGQVDSFAFARRIS